MLGGIAKERCNPSGSTAWSPGSTRLATRQQVRPEGGFDPCSIARCDLRGVSVAAPVPDGIAHLLQYCQCSAFLTPVEAANRRMSSRSKPFRRPARLIWWSRVHMPVGL